MHKLGMFAALVSPMPGTSVQAAPQLSYSIALQNGHGVETQALDLAMGGAAQADLVRR